MAIVPKLARHFGFVKVIEDEDENIVNNKSETNHNGETFDSNEQSHKESKKHE
jgi:hypothetical protein